MNRLSHKGYYGSNDIVTYEGTTVAEIKAHFAEAVEGYLQMRAELGERPDKPASGKFNVRIEPGLHRRAQEKAAILDVSLNDVVANALREYIENRLDKL